MPVTVLPDGAARGAARAAAAIDAVIVGCDRVAANGDVANKIGTLRAGDRRARITACRSTSPGRARRSTWRRRPATAIEIEQRAASEVAGRRPGAAVWNPAFDVTPASLITGLITDAGVLRAPYGPAIEEAVSGSGAGPSYRHDRSQVHYPGRPRADPVDDRADQRMVVGARARRRRRCAAPAAGQRAQRPGRR